MKKKISKACTNKHKLFEIYTDGIKKGKELINKI